MSLKEEWIIWNLFFEVVLWNNSKNKMLEKWVCDVKKMFCRLVVNIIKNWVIIVVLIYIYKNKDLKI